MFGTRLFVKTVLFSLVAMGAVASSAQAMSADEFKNGYLSGKLDWQAVEKQARAEGTVRWYHWGGSDQLNAWIDRVVKPGLAEKGIALETSRIASTRDAVDLVLAERQSGKNLGQGSVDLIWLNGDNFYTLKSQNALFGSFLAHLPNAANFELNRDDPRAQLNLSDFGVATDGQEVPWSGEQYVCYVDTNRLTRDDAPKSFDELYDWLKASPGRFTYVKPPSYIGNTFVQTVMYAHDPSGRGFDSFQGNIDTFTPELFASLTRPGFEYLRKLEPYLLGGSGDANNPGSPIYPANQQANQAMFNNGEVDMGCEFGLYLVDAQKKSGAFPKSAETLIFPQSGMIKNKNFLAIPVNSPNPAAALVMADFMSRVDIQISKLQEIGYPLGIDGWKLSAADNAAIAAAAPSHHGVTAAQLAAHAVADTNASLVRVIEKIWIEYIAKRADRPFIDIVRSAMAAK